MKPIRIEIPEPCHEHWDRMSPNENGRHCASCNKTVRDFTGASDARIAQFFKENPDGVCGRFHADQLNRDLTEERKRLPWLRYLFAIAIPAFFLTQRAVAQGKVNPLRSNRARAACDTAKLPALAPQRVVTPSAEKVLMVGKPAVQTTATPARTFRGTVVDEQGRPLAFASVMVAGGRQGTITDTSGQFTLTWKQEKRPIVEVTYLGYKAVTMELGQDVTPVQLQPFRMNELGPSGSVFFGYAVPVVRTTVRKKPAPANPLPAPSTKTEPKIISTPEIKVYPNPVFTGASFRMDVGEFSKGTFDLSILDINGRTVLQKRLELGDQTSTLVESTASLLPGTYFLRLVDQKSREVRTAKLLVQ